MVNSTEERELDISGPILVHSKDFSTQVQDHVDSFVLYSNIHNILALKGRRDLIAHKRFTKEASTLMEPVIHNGSSTFILLPWPSQDVTHCLSILLLFVEPLPCFNVVLIPAIYTAWVHRDQDIQDMLKASTETQISWKSNPSKNSRMDSSFISFIYLFTNEYWWFWASISC